MRHEDGQQPVTAVLRRERAGVRRDVHDGLAMPRGQLDLGRPHGPRVPRGRDWPGRPTPLPGVTGPGWTLFPTTRIDVRPLGLRRWRASSAPRRAEPSTLHENEG